MQTYANDLVAIERERPDVEVLFVPFLPDQLSEVLRVTQLRIL